MVGDTSIRFFLGIFRCCSVKVGKDYKLRMVGMYPTEEQLKRVREWNIFDDMRGFVDYITSLWEYPDYIGISKRYSGEKVLKADNPKSWQHKVWSVSTAGWSGNESLIGAMKDNFMFWSVCWHNTRKGGHYTFHLRRDLWEKK